MATGPYRVDNLRIDSFAVATNQTFASAFRGFGGPQACFAYEQQMDVIAEALNMDPLDVRKVNYVRTGDLTANGQKIESAVWLEETATRALEALGEKTPDHDSVKVGWGLASYFQSYGRITWFHDTSRALGGSGNGRHGCRPLWRARLGRRSGEQFGADHGPKPWVSRSRMSPCTVPTRPVTPLGRHFDCHPRSFTCPGNAVLMAANTVRQVLLERAQQYFEEELDNLDLADGIAFVKSDPERTLPLAELAAMCASEGKELANLAQFNAPLYRKCLTRRLDRGEFGLTLLLAPWP